MNQKITMDYYEQNAGKFKESTINIDMTASYNMLLKHLKKGDSILDLGCGPGRDAKVFLDRGFNVTMVDGSRQLCHIAAENTGQEPICALFGEMDLGALMFEGVWACASLLHLSRSEIKGVLSNVVNHMRENAVIFMNFKYGAFEGIREGRFYTDLDESSIAQLIANIEHLEIMELDVHESMSYTGQPQKWLKVLCKKQHD